MATVQERLQINRALLDTWNTREQLCLASAVSCSGDQNWMSVSRNLKLVCGTHAESNSRPNDFFSQKSCALQYAHLLENVETPKRKKRTSEGNSRVGSPAIGETPTDSVLRRLTDQRIQELKTEIRKDQEEYAKIYAELQKIQSPQLSEEMLRDMWREIEQEQEAQRIAEMKAENQLREREQKRLELQRSWRLGGTTALPPVINVKQQQDIHNVAEMDVEEIIGVTKPINQTPQLQQPTATSPLLSSLLKSPTATVAPSMNTASSARTNAPTITTLLTSGSIPQSNQPAITLNSNLITPEKAVQLLSRPISGPPVADSINTALSQNLLSPSQSAPTLSMLLEKSKTGNQSNVNVTNVTACENVTTKGETPMDIESIKCDEQATDATADSDEPDPNEEQQLLEVFKNIGNIDELDIDVSAVIDEEVDFLKGVDDSPATATEESTNLTKLNATENNAAFSAQTSLEKTENKTDVETATKTDTSNKDENVIKIETSSDDSNDNIPLAAVATLEHKDRSISTPTVVENIISDDKSENDQIFLKDKVESATLKNVDNVKQGQHEETETASSHKNETEANNNEGIRNNDRYEQKGNDANVEKTIENSENPLDTDVDQDLKSTADEDDEQMERFLTPTGEEKLTEQDSLKVSLTKDEDNKSDAHTDFDHDIESSLSNAAPIGLDEPIDRESHESNSNNDVTMSTTAPLPPPSIVSIADTDEDSCTTDISITTKRDEKSSNASMLGTAVSKSNNEKTSLSQLRKSSVQDASAASTASKSTTAADDSDSSSSNRASKRSLLNILSNLSASKSAQSIQRALHDEQSKHNYQKICLRRLDFQTIKKNIENGNIRTTTELQRDLLLMTQNVCFLFSNSNSAHKAADVFKHEMQNVREFIFNTNEFESKNEKEVREIKQAAVKQVRTGSRKSLRIA